jgi:nifR3 family TIM-barrel protein
MGADFSFTELASSEALTRRGAKTFEILRRGENETRYAVQLFGSDPQIMYRAALLLAPFGPEAVDINAGCPVLKVVKTGAGSALMRDPANLGRVVEAVVRASAESLGGVPVSVKMRSGWDSQSVNYAECARIAAEAGASMISLHPRTRAQGYGGKSDWTHIANLVSRIAVPSAGSGDLNAPEDAERMFRQTGCAAVMFARGSLGNPFIFRLTREYLLTGTWRPPEYPERFAAAFRHLGLRTADIGEGAACREMRKTFCAYTKGIGGGTGLSGGARLRERLVHAETVAEDREILSPWFPQD